MTAPTKLPIDYGFPAIAGKHAHTLILGSMPGIKSLEDQQYYAHPRNAFWPIMSECFHFKLDLDYQQRTEQLIDNHIAVWDVLKACHRPGSLDHHIDDSSSIHNDFNHFFQQHNEIKRILFNGTKAQQVFIKSVLPCLENGFSTLARQRLPSTSPAHASLSFEQKLQLWQQALDL